MNLKKFKEIKLPHIFFAAMAFAASQRFYLSDIYAHTCFMFLVLALIQWRNNELRNTLLIFALYSSVDINFGFYNGTPSIERYVIYFFCIASLIENSVLSVSKIAVALFFAIFYVLLALINIDNFVIEAFYSDVKIILAILFLFSFKNKSYTVDYELLIFLMLFYFTGEIVNYLFFFNYSEFAYLSLHTTKPFLCIFALYLFYKEKWFYVIPVFIVSCIIILAYGQRMIFLFFLLSFLFLIKNKKIFLCFLFIGMMSFLFIQNFIDINFSSSSTFRASTMLSIFNEGLNEEFFKNLDVVRYYEHAVVLGQNIINLLIGNGIGVGYFDSGNYFSWIGVDDFGFSEKEIDTKIFWGFHDFWTVYSYRFGLIFIIFSYLYICKGVFSTKKSDKFIGAILFILLNCSFYTPAGIILILMIYFSKNHEVN